MILYAKIAYDIFCIHGCNWQLFFALLQFITHNHCLYAQFNFPFSVCNIGTGIFCHALLNMKALHYHIQNIWLIFHLTSYMHLFQLTTILLYYWNWQHLKGTKVNTNFYMYHKWYLLCTIANDILYMHHCTLRR